LYENKQTANPAVFCNPDILNVPTFAIPSEQVEPDDAAEYLNPPIILN